MGEGFWGSYRVYVLLAILNFGATLLGLYNLVSTIRGDESAGLQVVPIILNAFLVVLFTLLAIAKPRTDKE